MDDSACSASELRQRYHKGGSAADDELTAAQLRARHGISSNKAGECIEAYYIKFIALKLLMLQTFQQPLNRTVFLLWALSLSELLY